MKKPLRGVAFFGSLIFCGGVALATPMTIPGAKGVIAWPKGAKITVYVPPDPDGLGREPALKEGILAWNDSPGLKARGITITTADGAPPAGATNAVTVTWAADVPGDDLGSGGPDGVKGPNGPVTTGGGITIERTPADVDTQMARNLGLHEMGHVLGLADVNTPDAAMNPSFDKTKKLQISKADEREIGAVYGANKFDTQTGLRFSVLDLGGVYRYAFDAEWLSGEALALFQVDADLSLVSSVEVPEGWRLDDFDLGAHATVDMIGSDEPPFLSFIIDDEAFYLGPDNPRLSFAFLTSERPGRREVFLSGRETVAPVDLPQGYALALTAAAALAAFGARRTRSQG
jgi:hypothetical protein